MHLAFERLQIDSMSHETHSSVQKKARLLPLDAAVVVAGAVVLAEHHYYHHHYRLENRRCACCRELQPTSE